MASTGGLKVCIIGSGLAGLTAARVLREHHQVTVFERGSLDVATGGQGMSFFSSAVKILKSLGYDHTRVRVVPSSIFRVMAKDGTIEIEAPLNFDTKYGAAPWTGLRADAREELFRLAIAPSADLGISGDPAKIVPGAVVVDVNPEEGIVTLEDGSTFQADLVIVADGIHSRLCKTIQGDQNYFPRKTGLTIYRVAISMDTAKELLPPGPSQPKTALIVTYPCRDFHYLHLSCILSTSEEKMQAPGGSWFDDADFEDVIKAFSDFPDVAKLLKAGHEAEVWDMQDLDPLPFWNRGRAIVIGDAAHAMTPMMGIGAALAIEDGESFRLFDKATSDEVPGLLAKMDHYRRPRAAETLANNRNVTTETSSEDRMLAMHGVLTYDGIYHEMGLKDDLSRL
ncbi:FAD binding domain protein [Leptodontidium sp. MPI-SDFR-AT-0119]|nr:FAD binding domain protein [Leptodontidium sp. MPI-SDFR-AT-0119]